MLKLMFGVLLQENKCMHRAPMGKTIENKTNISTIISDFARVASVHKITKKTKFDSIKTD
jgi:hypothetical protein